MQDSDLLIRRLIEHSVEFVIVGGFAAVAHGVTLVTQDMDVCCRFSAENLLRLQRALDDLHPVHRITPQRPPLAVTAENWAGFKNLYISTDIGVLDCLGTIAGVGNYDDVVRCSMEIELDIGTCRILTIDALIKAKRAMNRPRDAEAVLQLEAIREESKRERD